MNSSQLDSFDQDIASSSVEEDESAIAYEGFPYLSNFVELSNGLNMHYLDEGSGDPIVLLHGAPSSSFLWRNIIPELSERGRVIVPDLINYGLSDKTEALTFVEQGELLSEFIDDLGLDDITFVLHDWGGPIGMTHVVDNPDDVKALAFFETFVLPFPDLDALGGRSTPFIQQFIDPANNQQVVIEDNLFVEGILLDPQFGGIAEMPTEFEKAVYREPFLEPSSREQLLKTLEEIPILDTTDHPLYDPDGPGGVPAEPVPNIQEFIDFSNFLGSEVDIPKLFIVASPGRIVPPVFAPNLQESIPGVEIQRVGSEDDPAFHFLQEDATEDFTAALSNWLDSSVLPDEIDKITEIPVVLVNSANSDEILRFNADTGEFIDVFISGSNSESGLDAPSTSIFGPDGNLYVSSGLTNEIQRFDSLTGEFIDVFASGNGLNFPGAFLFGPDGNLYVSNTLGNNILRFDGNTGEFIDIFASGNDLFNPAALRFGSDGNLYVSSSGFFEPDFTGTEVLRFEGDTGEFIDVFASGGGLSGPLGLIFGPDDNLYVSSSSTSEVLRFNGDTGEFIDVFASGNGLSGPAGLNFGPDGDLYVGNNFTNEVLRFDGNTGGFVGIVASGNGLDFVSTVNFSTISIPTGIELPLAIDDIFDESYYLDVNQEAVDAVAQGEFATGLEHFLAVGLEAGLRFSPLIDLNYYQRVANPDLNELTNRQALDHLLEVGIEAGRLFSPFIDLDFYRSVNSDLSDFSNSEVFFHLREVGLDQGRQFSPFVNLEEYRSFSPELSDLTLADTFTHLATFFAPEDEGRIRTPFAAGRFAAVDSVNIVTPELLAGSGEAIFTYSKSANEVIMELTIDGLPFRPDISRSEDVSTPFNRQLVSVEDSRWQVWVISKLGSVETNFWYDGQTGDLIGNEFDVLDTPISGDDPVDINGDGIVDLSVQLPANQAIGSPLFEGNAEGVVDVTFEFAYDQLLDERGTGGVLAAVVPYNLNRPDEFGIYYTEGGLPVSEAATWDDVLTTIRNTNSFSLFVSSEPDPKPDFLASRDNTMIAHSSIYPYVVPEGVIFDAIINSHRFAEPTDLVTNSGVPFPARLAELERESELVFANSEVDEFDAVAPSDAFDGNRDTLFAGAGDDFVDASQAMGPLFPSTAGGNRIYSGTGVDEILASQGDRISGGSGDDTLDAAIGSGGNRLSGGAGNDELFAGTNDRLFGGDGDDILDATAGSGNNRIYGQDGNDAFFAGSGDRLLGGDGDDAFFVTDGGDNLITGGPGSDAFWIATGEFLTTANTITDFELDTDVIGVAGLGAIAIGDLEFRQVGSDATITFSGFDLAVLLNTQASALQNSGTFAFA